MHHRGASPQQVLGLAWCGERRLAFYSSAGSGSSWRNRLALLHLPSGRQTELRGVELAAERAPICALLVSPSGGHVLLLHRGAPTPPM